jgi:UDP-GlcNAc:undecaprenyl-phosphate GlcNAc-1-phosphate transferase
LPLLLLGLPILDMLTVIVGRIARGQSPFKADRTHLHHRLLDSGLSQSEAVALVYGLQFLLVALAYLLRDAADWLILLTYLLFCALALSGERAFEHYRARLYARSLSQRPLGRFRRWLRDTRLPVHLSYRILGVAVPSYLILGALSAQSVGGDIGLLAGALGAALLAALFIRRLPFFALERLSAYTAAVAVAFLLRGSQVEAVCSICIVALYGILAVAAALWIRFSGRGFQVTTLDMLVLLGALVAPSLREFGLKDIGTLALVAIVLFYSIEILLQGRARSWDALRVATLTCLGILAVKGLLL